MAAYAALVSLMHIIDDIQHHHSPPISIPKQQLQLLTPILTSLLKFLEASQSPVANGDQAGPFEMRIAEAAYAAEDVIESHLVDAIQLADAAEDVAESHLVDAIPLTRTHQQQTRSVAAKISRFFRNKKPENIDDEQTKSINFCRDLHTDDEQTKSINFGRDLQRVVEDLYLINKMAVEMDTEKSVAIHAHNVSAPAAPLRSSSSSSSSSVMVCPSAVFNGFMEKVIPVGGQHNLQVIPIVGMGGIGKTTLALNIYEHQIVKEHFVVRGWATISQKYNTREILRDVLARATEQKKENLSGRSEDELGKELYQHLFGRRFLIVMDDMWSIDAWKRIQTYFPDNANDSRILVTTRLSQLSSQLNPGYSLQMEFLDKVSSWNLFSNIVFGEGSCPHELIEIGEKIVENCRGLPLSIVVVGGVLKKKQRTRECWESIRDNLTSEVNLGNDYKHCLRLLKLSYNHLPVHLKPCFLYMGIFEEDDEIRVSTVIKLWVSEGFLKPENDRSLETIARGFLNDLADRNLILIDRRGYSGNMKSCKIHDMLRDLCLNQGQKEGFHHVIGRSEGMNRQCRRVVIPRNTSEEKVLEVLQSRPRGRSVICEYGKFPRCQNIGLLRTFHAYKFRTFEDKSYMNSVAIQYVNLRHLAVEVHSRSSFFSSLHLFWNLHTLIISCPDVNDSPAPVEIWKMPQFRHIEFPVSWVCLPDPPSDVVIMKNLQVLKGVKNFKCSEEVVKRIPNIKTLKVRYSGRLVLGIMMEYLNGDFVIPDPPPIEEVLERLTTGQVDDYYCLSNIESLSKLEHLGISCYREAAEAAYLQNLSFPLSLKTLSIEVNVEYEWEQILDKIGSLPNLEKLKLWNGCFGSGKWEMVEGQFTQLKYLGVFIGTGLKEWVVEDSCVLPRLEQIYIVLARELEEFPIEIGNIATLKKIILQGCSESLVKSAKEMVDEQVESQGEQLSFHVQVRLAEKNERLLELRTTNFRVRG